MATKNLCVSTLLLVIMVAHSFAQESRPAPDELDRSFKKISTAHNATMQKFFSRLEEKGAKLDEDELSKWVDKNFPDFETVALKLKILISSNEKSRFIPRVLQWIVLNSTGSDSENWAFNMIAERFLKEPCALAAMKRLAADPRRSGSLWLEALSLSKDPKIRVQSQFAWARQLRSQKEFQVFARDAGASNRMMLMKMMGKKTFERTLKLDLSTNDKRIFALLQEVVSDAIAKKVPFRGLTLFVAAQTMLTTMTTFAVGSQVPDIIGSDVDGNKFSLGDYKGKVILLDFWGAW